PDHTRSYPTLGHLAERRQRGRGRKQNGGRIWSNVTPSMQKLIRFWSICGPLFEVARIFEVVRCGPVWFDLARRGGCWILDGVLWILDAGCWLCCGHNFFALKRFEKLGKRADRVSF